VYFDKVSSTLYGCSSDAYQVEGAYDEDGRSPSVWDKRLEGQEDGKVAADSYHMGTEDLKLLQEYGCTSYRFSVSWPRIKPEGQ
jgi:beta-glucosidase